MLNSTFAIGYSKNTCPTCPKTVMLLILLYILRKLGQLNPPLGQLNPRLGQLFNIFGTLGTDQKTSICKDRSIRTQNKLNN